MTSSRFPARRRRRTVDKTDIGGVSAPLERESPGPPGNFWRGCGGTPFHRLTRWCNVFASDQLFLGSDLLAWLILALGGALAVGNLAALVRPPDGARAAMPTASMRRRAWIFTAAGLLMAVWAGATLASG